MDKRKPSAGAKHAATGILAFQVAITVLASVACVGFVSTRAAYSAAIGGGISIIATAYFAWQVLSQGPGCSAAAIANRFYIGEVIKLALTAILFTLVAVFLDVSFLPLFLTYIATLPAFWVALPLTVDTSVKRHE